MSSEPPFEPALEPTADETLDRLSGTLQVLQRRRGHRATSDDVLLAGLALRFAPSARRLLDLGTGKGTVALLLARALPDARVVGVEAVPQSHALAVRNARLNGLEARFEPRLGDLRAHDTWANAAPYDLVTGAPPFMPLGTGPLPADPQRAAGRFELRGGIEAYAEAAARALSPDGRVVLLMDGRGLDRMLRALQAFGLAARAHVEVRPRPASPPTYQVVVAAVGPANAAPLAEVLPMRGDVGEAWSSAYQALRERLDL